MRPAGAGRDPDVVRGPQTYLCRQRVIDECDCGLSVSGSLAAICSSQTHNTAMPRLPSVGLIGPEGEKHISPARFAGDIRLWLLTSYVVLFFLYCYYVFLLPLR